MPPPLQIVGHALVSAEGHIAGPDRRMPATLRSEQDWARFQAALDRATLVVLGRHGHERHPNPGRRRLVVTGRVEGWRADAEAIWWNPAELDFEALLQQLGIAGGTVAVAGGTAVFDLFLPRYTHFDLVVAQRVRLAQGAPCFSAGPPQAVLAAAGLQCAGTEALEPGIQLQRWQRLAAGT